MKTFFNFVMGLSILLSQSFLVSICSYPSKQFPIKTQLTNKITVNTPYTNRAESEIFGQSEYGEQNIALTIRMTGYFGTYGNEKIIRLNPTSVDDAKKFYETFFGDTQLDTLDYDNTGERVKREVKKALDEKEEQTHALENFKDLLKEYIESPIGGNDFYGEFTGATTDNSIWYQDAKKTIIERQNEYRVDGQILQIAIMNGIKDGVSNDPRHYYIFGSRVFPNSSVVQKSGAGKYFKNEKIKTISAHVVVVVPTGATLVCSSSLVQSGRIENNITLIWLTYAKKFNLFPTTRYRTLLLFNKTGNDEHHHPKFYKYKEKYRNPFRRPEKENCGFNIINPNDKSKIFTSLGLILLCSL